MARRNGRGRDEQQPFFPGGGGGGGPDDGLSSISLHVDDSADECP